MDLRIRLFRFDYQKARTASFIDQEYVMHIMFAGQMKMQIRETTYDLGPGEVVLIPSKTLHAVATSKRVTMIVIHFQDASNELQRRPVGPALRPARPDFNTIRHHADEIREILATREPAAHTLAAGHLQIIIGLLQREATTAVAESPAEPMAHWHSVQAALQFMQRPDRIPRWEVSEKEWAKADIGLLHLMPGLQKIVVSPVILTGGSSVDIVAVVARSVRQGREST